MMEEVLYGCDVMPSAIHITGSTLSGIEPSVSFESSRLYTMPYGRQKDGSVKVGSLELLQASETMTLFNTSDPAMRTGSAGEETSAQILVDVQDGGFDMVIMNPPFTRNTTKEGAYAGTFAAAFAAFNASGQDQRAMAKRMFILKRESCYHGHAGMASAFAALANRKLKPGGVLAVVLPLSATTGLAWQGFRRMLASSYTDVTVLTIASAGNDEMSFSADTGMGECLVIARKLRDGEPSGVRSLLSSLTHRPTGFAHASSLGGEFIGGKPVRRIEDGPYGGTALMIGDELTGEMITAPCQSDGESWGAVRLADHSLAQVAYALSQSELWLPGTPSAIPVRTALLGKLGEHGFHDLDITGLQAVGPPQGPFSKTAPSPYGDLPLPVEPQCHERNADGMFSRFTITGKARHGGKGGNGVGVGQSRPTSTAISVSIRNRWRLRSLNRRASAVVLGRTWLLSISGLTTPSPYGATAPWGCCCSGGIPIGSRAVVGR